ncbi:MAG TPA: GlsB/YeaQ/YmgE family stress response membrane protein [Anaerolineae bacterium]|nr:GlsB/YeaQ/YmgE family stress response membrane protein [Anaerolineae bacterium]
MTIVGLIVLLVIAAIAGSIGQALAGYSLGGCLVSTVVGFIGAFLGLWLARQFGLPEFYTISVGGETFPVIWSIIGSFILALMVGLLTGGRRRRMRG